MRYKDFHKFTRQLLLAAGILLTGGYPLTANADKAAEQFPMVALWDFSQAKSLPYKTSTQTLFENVRIRGVPHTVIMKLMVPIQKTRLRTVEIPFRTITIDGFNADWVDVPPVVEDPLGDVDPQSSQVPWSDLARVYMARDNTYLYFLMTVHDVTVSSPDIKTLYWVEFQQYLNQLHTPGDRSAAVGYSSSNEWIVTVRDRSLGGLFEVSFPPDYVRIGAGFIEWKVPIIAMQFPLDPKTPQPYSSPLPPPPGIENQFIRTYIHPGPHPNPPPVSDSNDTLTRPMIVNFYKSPG